MRKPLMLLVLALAAIAVFATACGDDNEENTAATPQTQQQTSTQQDIVVLAQGQRNLSTLVDAVAAAELAETLKAKGPYTVFAPTNEAFAALGDAKVQELLKPENRAQLKAILTYHVVPGELKAADLKDGQKVKTVQGETLTVRVKGGKVTVNDATVVRPNVEASNGVVHVIDGVLTPPSS